MMKHLAHILFNLQNILITRVVQTNMRDCNKVTRSNGIRRTCRFACQMRF